MEQKYPHETLGRTLLEETVAGELRRVYARPHDGWLEVGEFTRGPLTRDFYFCPAHLHCVHIDDVWAPDDQAAQFFETGSPFLVDYMDDLDAREIPYGYFNCDVGSSVSYRPARVRATDLE